jgi:hypothetical protein
MSLRRLLILLFASLLLLPVLGSAQDMLDPENPMGMTHPMSPLNPTSPVSPLNPNGLYAQQDQETPSGANAQIEAQEDAENQTALKIVIGVLVGLIVTLGGFLGFLAWSVDRADRIRG